MYDVASISDALPAPQEPADRSHQLISLLRPLGRLGTNDTVVSVLVEQPKSNLVKRSLNSRNLRQDINAVAILVNHSLDAADLTLHPTQPLLKLVLRGRVSANRGGS